MNIGVREHEGNITGTCVNKSNAICFENEFRSLHSKGKPIPVNKKIKR